MLSTPIPLAIFIEILHFALPPVVSVTDVGNIVLFTRVINQFRWINQDVRTYIDKVPTYFNVCFFNMIPPRTKEKEALAVNALRKRCLKANCLTLVLRFAEGVTEAENRAIGTLLGDIAPIVNKIHLYAPTPLEIHHGASIFGTFLYPVFNTHLQAEWTLHLWLKKPGVSSQRPLSLLLAGSSTFS